MFVIHAYIALTAVGCIAFLALAARERGRVPAGTDTPARPMRRAA